MLKFLWLLALTTLVRSDDPPPPGGEDQTNEEFLSSLFGDLFKMPGTEVTDGLTTDSLTLAECKDADIYNTEEAVAEIDTEEEYLCAFIAYQINKVKDYGIGQYTDEAEATRRYPYFKKCVQDVNKWNSESENTVFEVNFFCDMTEEERGVYSSAHTGGGDRQEGFGLGSAAGQDTSSEKPPNNVILTLFADKFKMPSPSVAGGLTTDGLTLADCVDPVLYDSEEVLEEMDEEEEYLCAFVAFQINKVDGEGLPHYANEAEATKRYPLFKECVDYVKGLNTETDMTEFGVNFFCDMTTEEKRPYSSGDYEHYGEFGLGSGYDGGASETDAAEMHTTSYIILTAALANAFLFF